MALTATSPSPCHVNELVDDHLNVRVHGRGAAMLVALVAPVALLAATLCTGCEDRLPGKLIAPGLGRNVLVAPGGAAAAFLTDAAHPDDRTVPEDLVAGDLWLASVPAQGQPQAVKVGSGVPSSAGAIGFRPDGGALAFLASWRFRAGEGDLFVAAPGQAARKLATGVKSFTWAPQGGALAWVAQEQLHVAPAPLAAGALAPAASESWSSKDAFVHSFSWSPDATRLAARAPAQRGGALWLFDAATGAGREVAKASTDFLFAVDGALGFLGPAGPKGGDRELSLLEASAEVPQPRGRATSFGFSPDGAHLLLLSTENNGGDAFGSLSRLQRSGGAPERLGEKVSEWRYTSKGELLLLSGYDVRSRSGTLTLAPLGAAVRELGKKVQSFQISPRGDRVLYLVQAPQKGDFKVELWTAELAQSAAGFAKAPRKIDEGVYGYQLSTDGELLFWKSRCAGSSRSCSLFRAKIATGDEPVQLALAVAGFDLAAEGSHLLVAHPHKGATRAVDLSLLDAFAPPADHAPKPFALEVDPGSRFLDAAGKKVLAPLLTGRASAGVLVIDLP